MSFSVIPSSTYVPPAPRTQRSDKHYTDMLEKIEKSREEKAIKAEQALRDWERVKVPQEVDPTDQKFQAAYRRNALYNAEELGIFVVAAFSAAWFGLYAAVVKLAGGTPHLTFLLAGISVVLGAATLAILIHADKVHCARQNLKDAYENYENTLSPYWQTHRKRPHAAALPKGTHNTYAVHIEYTNTGERLQVVEYRDIGPLQRRVIEIEDVLPDVEQAQEQAARLAEYVRELETQSWRNGQEETAQAIVDNELAQERYRQSKLTEKELEEQTRMRRETLSRTLAK